MQSLQQFKDLDNEYFLEISCAQELFQVGLLVFSNTLRITKDDLLEYLNINGMRVSNLTFMQLHKIKTQIGSSIANQVQIFIKNHFKKKIDFEFSCQLKNKIHWTVLKSYYLLDKIEKQNLSKFVRHQFKLSDEKVQINTQILLNCYKKWIKEVNPVQKQTLRKRPQPMNIIPFKLIGKCQPFQQKTIIGKIQSIWTEQHDKVLRQAYKIYKYQKAIIKVFNEMFPEHQRLWQSLDFTSRFFFMTKQILKGLEQYSNSNKNVPILKKINNGEFKNLRLIYKNNDKIRNIIMSIPEIMHDEEQVTNAINQLNKINKNSLSSGTNNQKPKVALSYL